MRAAFRTVARRVARRRALTPQRPAAAGGLRHAFRTDVSGVVGLVGILVIIAAALAAPLLAPADPLRQDLALALRSPSLSHPFGTDAFGRDIFSRVLYGARLSLTIAAIAAAAAAGVGVLVGLVSAFFGGLVDAVLMRVVDFTLAAPGILLALSIVAILGAGPVTVVVAVCVVAFPTFARLVRARALEVLAEDYVLAANCAGASRRYLMFRTVLPNTLAPVIVQLAIIAAGAVLLEAALSFLGLGTQPPAPSWGSMLNDARSYLGRAPWYAVFPGLALTSTVLAFDAVARSLQRSVGASASFAAVRRGA